MAGIKIVDLPALGRDLLSTDLFEMSIGGTASRKITGQEIMNASKLNVGSTPIVSGTVGRVLFQGTGNVLQQSSSLFWDSTNNRLGIGTSIPAEALDVVGRLKGTTSAAGSMFSLAGVNNTSLSVANDSSGRAFIEVKGNTAATSAAGAYFTADGYQESWFNVISREAATNNKIWRFGNLGQSNYFGIQKLNDAANSILSNALIIFSSTSNIGINTTTDAGFRLDVNGTARVQGLLTTPAGIDLKGWYLYANGTSLASIYGGSNWIFETGSGGGYRYRTFGGVERMRLESSGNLLINTTTDDGFKLDVNGTARVQGNAHFGTGVAVTVGTDQVISMRSSTTTARFYLQNSGTGTNSLSGVSFDLSNSNFEITNRQASGTTAFITNGAERMRVASTGNVLIGTTTDAGFRLDVNGTARFQGETQIGLGTTGVINNLIFNSNRGGAGLRAGIYWSSGSSIINRRKFSGGNDNTLSFLVGTTTELLTIQEHNGTVVTNNVGINNTNPNPSAVLDVASTIQGFLPPRMTNAQRTAIVSPAVGLIVYCTDVTEGLWVYKSTGWTFIV